MSGGKDRMRPNPSIDTDASDSIGAWPIVRPMKTWGFTKAGLKPQTSSSLLLPVNDT